MDKHGVEVSRDARDLISKMLCKNRNERLGKKDDVNEIINHPWFKEIDMDELYAKSIKPPFIPKIEGNRDL
jgi:serine/threonine protein kinase